MKKAIAEFIGTFTLVFLGCSAIVFAGNDIGLVGISLAFGLALIGMAYGIGPISGCHINPAVSVGAWVAGRMDSGDLVQYVVAQCLGAIAAIAVLSVIAMGKVSGGASGLGVTGWSDYSMMSAFVFEAVATFLFVVVILGATQSQAPAMVAGLAIGIALVAIHLAGIPVSGASVNPARSLGPAIFSGGTALAQLWLYIVAPCLGAAAAGFLFKNGTLEAD